MRTLTAAGERTRDVSLAADSGAVYAAWVTGGVTSRHAVRVVRIAGSIVGTVRTLSASDGRSPAPPAFAMTPARARADRLRDDQRPHPAGHATGRMTRMLLAGQAARGAASVASLRQISASERFSASSRTAKARWTRSVCSGKSRSTSSWTERRQRHRGRAAVVGQAAADDHPAMLERA